MMIDKCIYVTLYETYEKKFYSTEKKGGRFYIFLYQGVRVPCVETMGPVKQWLARSGRNILSIFRVRETLNRPCEGNICPRNEISISFERA